MHLLGWLSLHHLVVFFWSFDLFFHLGNVFFFFPSDCLLHSKGWSHRYLPVWGNKASKYLTGKTCGGSNTGRRNSQPHRSVCWRDPQGPRTYTNPPTQESAWEGPICSWLVGEVTENRQRAEQVCSPLDPPTTYSITTQRHGLPNPGKYLRLCPLQSNRCAKTKKYGPNL